MEYIKISDKDGGTFEEKISPVIINGDDLKIELLEIDKNMKTLEIEPDEILEPNNSKFHRLNQLEKRKEEINIILNGNNL